MKKKGIILLLLLFSISIVWAQVDYVAPPLVIGVDSEMWTDLYQYGLTGLAGTIAQGETVYGHIGLGSMQTSSSGGRNYITKIIYDNRLYYVYSNNLRPAAGVYLPDDWITTIDAPRKWVMSYFIDVLRSQDRNTFLQYEKPWIDHYTWVARQDGAEGWYDDGYVIQTESLVFNGAGIIMGGFVTAEFFITDIMPFNNGYKITMVGDILFYGNSDLHHSLRLPFPRYSKRRSFDMIFIPDGDYMDVYLDSLDSKFATFAKVDAWVLDEVEKLIWTSTCDISQIQWPRRAPKQLNVGEEGLVLENLRLRTSPGTAGSAITTMQEGSRVSILEIGPEATIDGVSSLWVKVQTSGGETGWCFGLYLRETQFDPTPQELTLTASFSVSVSDNAAETESINDDALLAEPEKKKSDFPVVPVIGFTAVVIGIVLVVIIKRRRQAQNPQRG